MKAGSAVKRSDRIPPLATVRKSVTLILNLKYRFGVYRADNFRVR